MSRCFFLVWMLSLAWCWAAPSPEDLAQLPAPAKGKINFKKQISPILETSCVKCHGKGKDKGGFNLDTREALMKGGDSGPAVVPGKSDQSSLIHLVAGLDPENIMPAKGTKLTAEQIGLLRAWIDQGLSWDPQITFAKQPPRNLHARRPEVSLNEKENPIDQLLAGYFRQHRVKPGRPVSDAAYARRVYLDVVGMTPTAEELNRFLSDRSQNKRAKLVRSLLADNQRYAEHWLTFWNDLLRNDYRGAGFIDGGRKQISSWLFSALATNMPYDQFVAQLVNPTPASEGFTKGIVWRGVVNASMTPPMQAAQSISQVFMGVNLKCASCHDSFISDWSLSDAYGLASIYSDSPLEMVECDKPLGKMAPIRFLYPELGSIEGSAQKPERLKQLATLMTRRENGRLPRTLVNRLWATFLGRGLVEPLDEMENPAWHTDLLDFLAEDLADNGYNIKHSIERILTSRAYQMESVGVSERAEADYVFKGPLVRRMSAEQFSDSLGNLVGMWNKVPAADFDFRAGKTPGELALLLGPETRASWIWNQAGAAQSAPAGAVRFRKTVDLKEMPEEACVVVQADDTYKLFINGKEIPPNNDFPWFDKTSLTDIRKFLAPGKNVFAVEVHNAAAGPAGLLLYARLRSSGKPPGDVVSDSSWKTGTAGGDWTSLAFQEEGWAAAAVLGDYAIAPWKARERHESAVATAAQYGRVRAALVPANPLMLAMGRPNREIIMTDRAEIATTLQALELTNGSTLAEFLKAGAARLAASGRTADDLVAYLYESAVGRKPSAGERKLALEFFEGKVQPEPVEDLLWALIMLPEYQLIH